MKKILTILAGLMLVWGVAQGQQKDTSDVKQVPKKVMDALTAKFPKPQIVKWTREQEGDFFVYDIEFTQGKQKYEADINEDGTIHNWEKAIDARSLPAAVKATVDRRYPKAAMKEIMEITAVKNGKDELEGYEIVLMTQEKKEVEVTIAPDGRMLEDSGDTK